MRISSDLIYQITRKNNSFLRKNLHATFTADPFSASNMPLQSHGGFFEKSAIAIHPSDDPGKAADHVTVIKRHGKRRSTKTSTGKTAKMRNWVNKVKTIPAIKSIGNQLPVLAARGQRLYQASLRKAKFNKGSQAQRQAQQHNQ